VRDYLNLASFFDEVFRSILGWDGLGYIFRVHGQEFNSFSPPNKYKRLLEFQLRPQKKFSLHLRRDRPLGMGVTASGSGRRGGRR